MNNRAQCPASSKQVLKRWCWSPLPAEHSPVCPGPRCQTLCEPFPEPQTLTLGSCLSPETSIQTTLPTHVLLRIPQTDANRGFNRSTSAPHVPACVLRQDRGASCACCPKCSVLLTPPGLCMSPSGTRAFPSHQFKAGSRTVSSVAQGQSQREDPPHPARRPARGERAVNGLK